MGVGCGWCGLDEVGYWGVVVIGVGVGGRVVGVVEGGG